MPDLSVLYAARTLVSIAPETQRKADLLQLLEKKDQDLVAIHQKYNECDKGRREAIATAWRFNGMCTYQEKMKECARLKEENKTLQDALAVGGGGGATASSNPDMDLDNHLETARQLQKGVEETATILKRTCATIEGTIELQATKKSKAEVEAQLAETKEELTAEKEGHEQTKTLHSETQRKLTVATATINTLEGKLQQSQKEVETLREQVEGLTKFRDEVKKMNDLIVAQDARLNLFSRVMRE
jgi:chromosome segregation ATPase